MCNAQCPFLKDGLKWISGFDFGRVYSYRSHNLLAISRLESVKTVNDGCHLCLVPLPPYLSPLFLQPCASVPCAPWRNPPRCDVCGASTGTYTRSLAFHTHGALHPPLHDPTLPPGRVARAYSIILGMSLHLHTFEPHSAPRVDVPLGGTCHSPPPHI